MELLTEQESQKIQGFIWDELLDNPNYDQHCEINRPRLLEEIISRSYDSNPWPEFLPLDRLTEEQRVQVLTELVNLVSNEFDEPDPEALKD